MERLALRFVLLAIGIALIGTCLTPSMAEGQEGLSHYAVTPCRAYDSRGCPSVPGCTNGGGAIITDLHDNDDLRPIRIRGLCGVPNQAQAVSVNYTIIQGNAPTGGVARLCPRPLGDGQTICRAWTLYALNETISNGGILPLGVVTTPGTDNDAQLEGTGKNETFARTAGYTFHWTIDITGYFLAPTP